MQKRKGKSFLFFFDADTEKVYICTDQINSVENLYAVWAHENGHNATYHNFTEDDLSNLYDALGENRLKRAIPDSYFKMGLSKAMIADEYLSRILADIMSDEGLFKLVENNIDSVLEGLELLDNKILPCISKNLKYIFNGKKENYNREDESRTGVVGFGRNEVSAKNERDGSIQEETERRYRTGESTGEERGESERIDKSTLSLKIVRSECPKMKMAMINQCTRLGNMPVKLFLPMRLTMIQRNYGHW